MKRGKNMGRGKRSNSRLEFLLNRNILNSKRSQANVISIILIILLVMATVVIIIGVVLPFVREKLSSGDCFDVVGADSLEISPGYTCYDIGAEKMHVQIGIGSVRDLIEGFSIELGGASTDTYTLTDGITLANVEMRGIPGSAIELHPRDNTERTYTIKNVAVKPEIIKVYPILVGGRVCSASDVATTIDSCL